MTEQKNKKSSICNLCTYTYYRNLYLNYTTFCLLCQVYKTFSFKIYFLYNLHIIRKTTGPSKKGKASYLISHKRKEP